MCLHVFLPEDNFWESQSSPPTIWAPDIGRGSSVLMVSTFPIEPSRRLLYNY